MPKNEGSVFRLIIFVLITIICLGFSFVFMTIGYKEFGRYFNTNAGQYLVSGAISFVVVLILLYINYEIHKARRDGKSIVGLLILYIFFVLFSFAGNFNALYPSFMNEELLRKEVDEKNNAFKELKGKTENALKSANKLNENIGSKIMQLEKQIKDPNNKGCGQRCLEIIEEVEAIREQIPEIGKQGAKITRLKVDPSKTDEASLKTLFESYRDLLAGGTGWDILYSIERDLTNFDTKDLKTEVDYALESPLSVELSLEESTDGKANKNSPDNKKIRALELIKKIVEKYNAQINKVNARLGNKQFNALEVETILEPKINQTFSSALNHLGNLGTWISAFVALMIDLFVPLFIIIFTKQGESDTKSVWGNRGFEDLS